MIGKAKQDEPLPQSYTRPETITNVDRASNEKNMGQDPVLDMRTDNGVGVFQHRTEVGQNDPAPHLS